MRPFKKLIDLWEAFETGQKSPEVLFLGDSTLERVSDFDADRRTLPEMLQAELKNMDLVSVSYPAYTAAQYRAYVKAVGAMRHKPDVVIAVANLRSFSPVWQRQPEWSFSAEIDALKSFGRHKREDSFRLPEETAGSAEIKALRNRPIGVPNSKLKTVGDFLDLIKHKDNYREFDRLREVFLVYHHFSLIKQHPLIRHWSALIGDVINWGGVVYLYTAPINIQAGRKYTGRDFSIQPIKNINTFDKLIGRDTSIGGVLLENLSLDFPSDQFLQVKHPTEHLNESGRRVLAKRIAAGVEDLLNRNLNMHQVRKEAV